MRFSVQHPADPSLRADYGFDPFVGFFAEVFDSDDPDDPALLIYDAAQPGYDHERPLQGAFVFLIEHGFLIQRAVFDIERRLRADPTRAREALRILLKDGTIELEPQADGTYIARGDVLPLRALTLQPLERPKPRSQAAEAEGPQVVYNSSCAGALRSPMYAVFEDFEVILGVPSAA